MDEKERIHSMVMAGTITEAEAGRLLGLLDDIDRAEVELAESREAMEARAREATGPGHAGGRVPGGDPATNEREAAPVAEGEAASAGAGAIAAAPDGATASAGRAEASSAVAPVSAAVPVIAAADAETPRASPQGDLGGAPASARWLHLSLMAGDVDVRVDPAIDRVELAGDAEGLRLEPAADGFVLRHGSDSRGASWVERFLTRLRSSNVRVRVPGGYGVHLDVTAGDVDLDGVPYLRGRLTSGNLRARGLSGVDLVTSAGDIDLDMILTEGKHRLRATAGDVVIRLGSGSSVTVAGSVSIGNASVRAPDFEVDRRGVGQRFEGRVGGGAANLDVHVTTGNIDVKVER